MWCCRWNNIQILYKLKLRHRHLFNSNFVRRRDLSKTLAQSRQITYYFIYNIFHYFCWKLHKYVVQVKRYWNFVHAYWRNALTNSKRLSQSAYREWARIASSSSSQGEQRILQSAGARRRSVTRYLYIQDVSATRGRCSTTARRHSLSRTLWRTCDGVRHVHWASEHAASNNSDTNQPIPSTDGVAPATAHFSRGAPASDHHWGKLSRRFIDRTVNEWRRQLDCVVQQQGGHTEHLLQTKQ